LKLAHKPMSEDPKHRLDPNDLSWPPLKKHQDGTLVRSPLDVDHLFLDGKVRRLMDILEVSVDTTSKSIKEQLNFPSAIVILVAIVQNVAGIDQRFANNKSCGRLLKQHPELHDAVAEACEQGSFQSIRELGMYEEILQS
ncbi:hypothetical protein H0H81_003124, partial [Sphagnurus paluster]